MAGLLERYATTPGAKRRLRIVAIALPALVAVVSWWSVVEDGSSKARVITAAAATVAALVEAFVPKTRRLRRRFLARSGRNAPQAD